ncbi:MAG: hypothetical protein WC346_05915 [Methanogenium sp.]|jgi:hypothetical protein
MKINTNPFTIVFTDETTTSISVSLVNKSDELKLAKLFEMFLLEHDIPFNSIERQGQEKDGRQRSYTLKKIPGKLDINTTAIDNAMEEIKKSLTISEAESLLNVSEKDGIELIKSESKKFELIEETKL